MQVTAGLHRARLIRANALAVLDGSVSRTWQEISGRIARIAGALQSLGLTPGDRVALLMLNGHRYLELYYAVPWAAGVVMPLNIRLAPREILEQLADAEASVLVVDDAFARLLPALAGNMPSVGHVIHAGDGPTPEGTRSYEAMATSGMAIDDAGVAGDEIFGLFYTGGTTAASKGVMLSHRNVMTNAYNIALEFGYRPDDVYLHVAPMFHLGDGASTFALTMCAGTHAFVPMFDVARTLEAIQTFRVTSLMLVPTMIGAIVNSPLLAAYDLTSLRRILYGASPMPTALLTRALAGLPCSFWQGYGMTETSPVLTFLSDRDHARRDDAKARARLASAGTPVPNADVRILDSDENPLPAGTIGEICARGPLVMKGYWRKPEATAHALRGGFMHTGDLGYMDEDGYVFLVDRAKDMIVSGAENVYSLEVETALYAHEAVLEAAVFGIPHATLGEQVHAVVVLKEAIKASPDELIEHCRERIAGYKCPKTLELREEALPKSGAGKILKRDLRAPHWVGQERMIH